MVVTPATAALRFSAEAVSARPPPIPIHAIDIPDLGGAPTFFGHVLAVGVFLVGFHIGNIGAPSVGDIV